MQGIPKKSPQKVSKDKRKIHDILKMCLNQDYVQATEAGDTNTKKVGGATFTEARSSSDDQKVDMNSHMNLAFRKKARDALNMNQMIMKKLELHNYLEEKRLRATHDTIDFVNNLDPIMAPRNIKLMYYYYISSSNLYSGMQEESIAEFKKDDLMAKVGKNDRKKIFRGQDEIIREKIKTEYGRHRKIWRSQ